VKNTVAPAAQIWQQVQGTMNSEVRPHKTTVIGIEYRRSLTGFQAGAAVAGYGTSNQGVPER
jgi:hypothetical protein